MATKLDLTRPLFMGAKGVRENTFNDQVRRAVAALDEGEGVPYAKLEEYLLKNHTPAKSANYGPSFIKSYVRDAVNKYDLLSYENGGHEYSADAAPAARAKTTAPRKPTKARVEQMEVLKFIRDAGEVADASDVDNTQITPADIASELGKRRKTIDTKVAELAKEGLARTEDEPSTGEGDVVTHVYLTAAGLAAVNAMYPEGAESEEGADTGDADVEQVVKEG